MPETEIKEDAQIFSFVGYNCDSKIQPRNKIAKLYFSDQNKVSDSIVCMKVISYHSFVVCEAAPEDGVSDVKTLSVHGQE